MSLSSVQPPLLGRFDIIRRKGTDTVTMRRSGYADMLAQDASTFWTTCSDIISSFGASGSDSSHTLLNKGVIAIHDSCLARFDRAYASAVPRHPMFVNERFYAEGFPFAVDLDFKGPAPLSSADVLRVARVCQQAVQACMASEGNRLSGMLVTGRKQEQEVLSAVKSEYSTGLHLHFPELGVTRETAIGLRDYIVYQLDHQLGPRDAAAGYNTWPDVVDAGIYERCNLRMVFSRKAEDCRGMSGDDHKLCSICGGTKKVSVGREYGPLCYFDQSGERDLEREASFVDRHDGIYNVVATTRMRRPKESLLMVNDFRLPEDHPRRKLQAKRGLHASQPLAELPPPDKPANFNAIFSAAVNSGSTKRSNAKDLTDASVKSMMEAMIRGTCSEYEELLVQTVKVYRNSSTYVATVRGPKSKYCKLNQARCRREHKSNTIFFVLKPESIAVHCFDSECRRLVDQDTEEWPKFPMPVEGLKYLFSGSAPCKSERAEALLKKVTPVQLQVAEARSKLIQSESERRYSLGPMQAARTVIPAVPPVEEGRVADRRAMQRLRQMLDLVKMRMEDEDFVNQVKRDGICSVKL